MAPKLPRSRTLPKEDVYITHGRTQKKTSRVLQITGIVLSFMTDHQHRSPSDSPMRAEESSNIEARSDFTLTVFMNPHTYTRPVTANCKTLDTLSNLTWQTCRVWSPSGATPCHLQVQRSHLFILIASSMVCQGQP